MSNSNQKIGPATLKRLRVITLSMRNPKRIYAYEAEAVEAELRGHQQVIQNMERQGTELMQRLAATEMERQSLEQRLAEIGPCDVPPEGWVCSRPKGHSGPCAATEVGEDNEQ